MHIRPVKTLVFSGHWVGFRRFTLWDSKHPTGFTEFEKASFWFVTGGFCTSDNHTMNENSFSHQQLIQQASLTNEDLMQVAKCRRNYNRIGFGYQVGFVRLKNRFPIQQPFEIISELLTFTSIQLSIDSGEIDQYTKRQQTISQHQRKICQYFSLMEFVDSDIASLERFIFEQCCRLEQTSVLLSLEKSTSTRGNVLC